MNVCVFVFDMLSLNGESLVKQPLRLRYVRAEHVHAEHGCARACLLNLRASSARGLSLHPT